MAQKFKYIPVYQSFLALKFKLHFYFSWKIQILQTFEFRDKMIRKLHSNFGAKIQIFWNRIDYPYRAKWGLWTRMESYVLLRIPLRNVYVSQVLWNGIYAENVFRSFTHGKNSRFLALKFKISFNIHVTKSNFIIDVKVQNFFVYDNKCTKKSST